MEQKNDIINQLTNQLNKQKHINNKEINDLNQIEEPILIENSDRYVMFPVKYHDIWDMCVKHRKAFWIESEVDLHQDVKEWPLLNDGEKHFIKNVLAFFAASDGIVMENLLARFATEVQYSEARLFYAIQNFMEGIHSIMYSQLINTYVSDEDERLHLFRAIETMPTVRQKAEWAEKWISSSSSFATRLVAFAIVEGIFFSGSFCCIYWLKEQGKMPGLCLSNDFIAKDERLHTDFAALLYTKYIVNKLTQDEIASIMSEAVKIENEFITQSLPCSLLGMNANMMSEYIKFVSNRLLKQLGHTPIYENISQPFPFMERITLSSMTNFFEKRNSEYQIEVNDGINMNNSGELKFDAEF